MNRSPAMQKIEVGNGNGMSCSKSTFNVVMYTLDTGINDFVVISGRNTRHLKEMAEALVMILRRGNLQEAPGYTGYEDGTCDTSSKKEIESCTVYEASVRGWHEPLWGHLFVV